MDISGTYSLKTGPPPQPQEDDFSITESLAYMQRGLPASYDFADYIYVVDERPGNISSKPSKKDFNTFLADSQGFRKELSKIMIDNFPKKFCPKHSDLKTPDEKELVISSFDTEFWNYLSENKVEPYRPAWEVAPKDRHNPLDKDFPDRKKIFFKFNILMFFQVKKATRDQMNGKSRVRSLLTNKLIKLLEKYNLHYYIIEGESREFCGVKNAIIAGRFNDGQEKPKDPYTFYLHCLVGYDRPAHVGGSYLFAQKCVFDWFSVHNSSESLPGTIGRNEIKDGSTIFSQHHCPRSHIRLSRIKDNNGNPVTLHRESKSFTTESFDPVLNRSVTDNINPEEGLMFIAYHKDPYIIEKMMLSQLGNTSNSAYEDGLLNHFKVTHGNLLYTPNIFELTGLTLTRADIEPAVDSLCEYHQVRWLKNYLRNQADEQNWKTTKNPYFLYSRAGYMTRMSYANPEIKDLNPPSPRILRVVSRTFTLWQDTWYYNRRQAEMKHLQDYISSDPAFLDTLQTATGFNLTDLRDHNLYPTTSRAIRNGLAIYYNLAHLVSTKEYGCRGPIRGDPKKPFGANTFHLEPEDVLAGGEANLTFGQGKHVVEYLTAEEMRAGWIMGQNLSAHSGIGHVIPYMQDIMTIGLDGLIAKFKTKAASFRDRPQTIQKYELFTASVFSLLGMKQYFLNYANLAEEMLSKLGPKEVASRQSLERIRDTMRHLSSKPPTIPKGNNAKAMNDSLHQAVQLILSVFICLHLTGEPVSIGRVDYLVRKFVPKYSQQPTQEQQDIIDSFWLKVGEKANFNKGFFEDHQKWGNLAMGGNSSPYPQGASFNQWGHQLSCGGTDPNGDPFYNCITIACLRASRTIPVNAPCLGLRVQKNTPRFILEEAAKTALAGGAHPIIINDDKVIAGLRRASNYVITPERWNQDELISIDGESVTVPYSHWSPAIKNEDLYDFSSDGCHEFLMVGKSWFWLGGGCVLQGLEYVMNVGKSLIASGPRFIHGKRQTYRWRQLSTYQTYDQLEQEYFEIFQELMRKGFYLELSGFENISKVCPATLLNAFTANMLERQSDFYLGGSTYKIFCPQFTGVANLVNALWNIKKLVFEQKVTTLEQIRNALLVNWGEELDEPFVPRTLPQIMKNRLKDRCDMLRELGWRQAKFGLDREVTLFGFRISKKMSLIARKIFEQPDDNMLKLLKTLTYKYGSEKAKFGFQYTPGCGTFQNYADVGADMGASFDGRKKGQAIAEDYAPQNFFLDKEIGDRKYDWPEIYLQDILKNYQYTPQILNYKTLEDTTVTNDPEFFSGAVLDIYIDQSYDKGTLVENLQQFAFGIGPNTITISTGTRSLLEEARLNTERDLIRYRMGGWSEFAVAMFPHLLQHHIRRKRQIPKQTTQQEAEDEEVQKCASTKKRVKRA